jgi:hypothetical protein
MEATLAQIAELVKMARQNAEHGLENVNNPEMNRDTVLLSAVINSNYYMKKIEEILAEA